MANLLPDNFFDTLPQTPVAPQTPASSYTPTGIAAVDSFNQNSQPAPKVDVRNPVTKLQITPDLTPEEQTKKFGGPVGSPEYYDTISREGTRDPNNPLNALRAPHGTGLEIANSFGVKLPQGEEWDKLSTPTKVASVTAATAETAVRTVLAIPKTAARIAASIGLTAFKPFYNMFTGKPSKATDMEMTQPTNVPLLGEVPTYYETVEQARQSGMGPGMAYLFAGSDFVLKTAAMLPITEALVNTFKPRPYKAGSNPALPGDVAKNTEPIKFVQDSNGTYRAPAGSVAEYYTMPKTEASKFGGNSNTIKWKMRPSAEGEQTISVVLSTKAKPGTYVKTDYGLKQVQQGDFGPEIALYSAPIKMAPKVMDSEISKPTATPSSDAPVFILPEARSGLETRPITEQQLGTLKQIGQMKNIEPAVVDSVTKALTGKENIGDLNEAEYVRVAQTLSKFGEKYGALDTTLGPLTRFRSFASPPRHYLSYLEDTYGYPVNSQLYQPLERAQQLVKVLDSNIQPELDGIFGKYSSPKMVEERRLIDGYVRGDKAVITSNTTLTAEQKTEMIDVANKLTAWDNQYGEILGVGKEAYLANYGGPKIANLGGVFPQYKDLDVAPTKEFFAKFKREGSLDPYIDDPYSSRQIYIKEGAKALHYKPVLDNFEAMKDSLPPEIYRQANSYVQEKLGKLGGLEKILDSFVPKFNKNLGVKLGVELPADATRQGISYILSSMYSGLVGTPQAVFKQIFQLPTFVYSRLGTRFAGEALVKSLDPKQRARVAKLGYFNEISQPYGAELAKDFNPVNVAGRAFKAYTQATVKPMTLVDNDIRLKTFLQAEAQWDDAINQFNDGKIQWNNVESKLDFRAFSKSTADMIRQKFNSGDATGAFDVYVRDIIDETSFPYRTGSGARVGYGMSGKLATGLLNYTIESTNVLGRWIGSKQWEKLIRFAGNAKIMNDTLHDEFGMDFRDTFYQKPGGIASPVVGFLGNVYGYFKAIIDKNREEMNSNGNDIAKTFFSGVPSGLVLKNVNNFRKSINAGVDAEGKYAIYDNYGKLVRNGDFTDLFWGTLMGFPTVEKIDERNLYTDMKNAQTKKQEIQGEVNQLLREGKYDAMEKLIQKYGIGPSTSDMESSYVPRTQRLFEQMSDQTKVDFVPRVYPQVNQ